MPDSNDKLNQPDLPGPAAEDDAAPALAGAEGQEPVALPGPEGGVARRWQDARTRLAQRVAGPTERYIESARDQVRDRPLSCAAGAFLAGFVLAVVTRSR